MALFKKTYQDNLRELRDEQNAQDSIATSDTPGLLDPYASYVSDISDIDLEPIDNQLLYKRNFAKVKHSYKFEAPQLQQIKRTSNYFLDIEAMLYSMIPNSHMVDDDFLTGYYLTKYHLNLPKVMTSYHAGISKDSVLQGIYYAINKLQPKTKWQIFGCDAIPIKRYEAVLKNGIKKPCDIYNQNSSTSIKIQLSESIDPASVDLYICDVKSKDTADLLKQFSLILEYLSMNAQIVLRLPANWSQCYTSMSTTILFLIGQFKTVKIFKTPWGLVPKYYLILSGMKEPIQSKKVLTIDSYIKALSVNGDTPFISQTYYSIDEQEMLMQRISLAYTNTGIATELSITTEDAIQQWTDIVS
jgi:hypothetical protein